MSVPTFYDFFLNWKIKIHGGAIILIHPVQPLHTMSGDRLKDTICNSRFYYFNIYRYIYRQRSQQRSMCVYIHIYTQPKPKGRHLFSMMGRIRGHIYFLSQQFHKAFRTICFTHGGLIIIRFKGHSVIRLNITGGGYKKSRAH